MSPPKFSDVGETLLGFEEVLSLPKITSDSIRDEARRGSVAREPGRTVESDDGLANLCQGTGVAAPCCSSRRMPPSLGADVPRRSRRHGQGIPGGSIR